MHADDANAVCSTVSQKQWTPCVPEHLHYCEGRKVMGKRREILLSLPCQKDLSRFGTKRKIVWFAVVREQFHLHRIWKKRSSFLKTRSYSRMLIWRLTHLSIFLWVGNQVGLRCKFSFRLKWKCHICLAAILIQAPRNKSMEAVSFRYSCTGEKV